VSDVLDELYKEVLKTVDNMSEEDVTFFSSAAASAAGTPSLEGWDAVTRGATAKVSALDSLTAETRGSIKIEHGWVGADYLWHFYPVGRVGSWPVSTDRVLTAIVHTMNRVIPQTVFVDIFKPMLDWEIKMVTFKAKGLESSWNVTDEELRGLLDNLFNVLTSLK
jgi:hypothetical protein